MRTGYLSQCLTFRMGSRHRNFQKAPRLPALACSLSPRTLPPYPLPLITAITANIQLMHIFCEAFLDLPLVSARQCNACPLPRKKPITPSSGALSLSPCYLPLGRGDS